MNAPPALSRVSEWVLRSRALLEARAAIPRRGDRRDRALCQARLLGEVARRVAEPVEGLPRGSRSTVRLGLYREALYWALVATHAGADPVPDLAAAWAAADREGLRRAAPDDATLAMLERFLVERPPPDPLDVPDEDVARTRTFVEGMIANLDGPRRRVDRIRLQRWLRLGLLALVVAIAAWGIHRLALGPNLLAGKPFRTSSSWEGCASDAGCQALLFHTNPEFNPWVEFDLGAPRTFHRMEVANRNDCCAERAVPLIAETSNDRVSWKEIGRRDEDFTNWTVNLPPTTARYFRLRVARQSTFHLKSVALR